MVSNDKSARGYAGVSNSIVQAALPLSSRDAHLNIMDSPRGDKTHMEIIPDVHLIPDVVANPYLIVDSSGLTLIDAGLPGSHKAILKYIGGLGFSPKDLVR